MAVTATTSATAPRINQPAAIVATLAQETARQLSRSEATEVRAISGSTVPNIEAGPLIETVRRQTGLGARRAAILLPNDRRVRDSKLVDRAAI